MDRIFVEDIFDAALGGLLMAAITKESARTAAFEEGHYVRIVDNFREPTTSEVGRLMCRDGRGRWMLMSLCGTISCVAEEDLQCVVGRVLSQELDGRAVELLNFDGKEGTWVGHTAGRGGSTEPVPLSPKCLWFDLEGVAKETTKKAVEWPEVADLPPSQRVRDCKEEADARLRDAMDRAATVQAMEKRMEKEWAFFKCKWAAFEEFMQRVEQSRRQSGDAHTKEEDLGENTHLKQRYEDEKAPLRQQQRELDAMSAEATAAMKEAHEARWHWRRARAEQARDAAKNGLSTDALVRIANKDCVGVLEMFRWPPGTWRVRLLTGELVEVPPGDVTREEELAAVIIAGSPNKDANGKRVKLGGFSFNETMKVWFTRLANGELWKVLPTSLRLVSADQVTAMNSKLQRVFAQCADLGWQPGDRERSRATFWMLGNDVEDLDVWLRHGSHDELKAVLGLTAGPAAILKQVLGRAQATALPASLPTSPGDCCRTVLAGALIIGNNDYANVPLKYAVSDSRKMEAKVLELGWPKERVFRHENMTEDGLTGAVMTFTETVKWHLKSHPVQPGAPACHVALFFYAGHGNEKGSSFHMQCVDTEEGMLGVDWGPTLLQRLNKLQLTPQQKQNGDRLLCIFVVDACREDENNPTFRGEADGGELASEAQSPRQEAAPQQVTPGPRRSRALNVMFGSRTDFIILHACDPGRMAREDDTIQSGYCTHFVMKRLGAGSGDVLEAFQAVSDDVSRATDSKQRPWCNFRGRSARLQATPLVAG